MEEELVSNITDTAYCFIIFIYRQTFSFSMLIQKNLNEIKGFHIKTALRDECIMRNRFLKNTSVQQNLKRTYFIALYQELLRKLF